MKKGVKVKNLNRFAELARLGEIVFHTGDLANLWGITNKNTLYTTTKRYIEQGLLFRIHKGFFSIKNPKDIDPLLLGIKALHGYAYVSTETILREQGVIQQEISAISLVSDRKKRFTIGSYTYYSRKLPDEFLYHSNGITNTNGVRKASVTRAVADMLYFNEHAYFDAPKLIDWKQVHTLQYEIGYRVTKQKHV